MDLNTFICPYCKTVNEGEARNNYYYSCHSCHQAFIKHDKVFPKPEEIVTDIETFSPILIGSKGKIDADTFEVSGCVTLFLDRSTIDLYSIKWNNGMDGYIVEWDGEFNLIPYSELNPSKKLKGTKLGETLVLDNFGDMYCNYIDKVDYISVIGSGKLAFEKYTGSIFCSYLSENNKKAFAFFNKESIGLLTGKTYELEHLNLSQTRIKNGWYK